MKIVNIDNTLYNDICELIEDERNFIANTTNKSITILYWKMVIGLTMSFLTENEQSMGNR